MLKRPGAFALLLLFWLPMLGHAQSKRLDLLIINGAVVTMDGARHLYDNGFVAIGVVIVVLI